MQENVIKRWGDAGGHNKGEGWCIRTLQKGGMVQKDTTKGTDRVHGGQYQRGGIVQRTLQKVGHYIKEG